MTTAAAPLPDRAALVRRSVLLNRLTLGHNLVEGIVALAAASVVVTPLLARAKRRVGRALRSSALVAESRQTECCTWLSAILLAGLALDALLGWWWADPVAALAMVPIIGWEGVQAVRGRDLCGCGDACHG